MTEGPGAKDAPPTFTDEERAPGQDLFGLGEQERRELLAWVGEHLPRVRRSVYGQHFLYWSLGIAVVVGLAANVGGYLLKSSVTTEPLGLVADLLYELGYALWTGVVVVVFVQIIPEIKRRQFKQMLDAYEAARREKARAGSDQASGDDGAPTASSGGAQRLSLRAQISAQARCIPHAATWPSARGTRCMNPYPSSTSGSAIPAPTVTRQGVAAAPATARRPTGWVPPGWPASRPGRWHTRQPGRPCG
jgi:hypothetical protein